jgi:tetratricopeptide (TPR) repeat protein
MGKKLLILIFFIALSSQSFSSKYEDSIQTVYDSLVSNARISLRYFHETAKQQSDEALEIANANNIPLSPIHLLTLAQITRTFRHYDSSLVYFNQALDSFLLDSNYYHVAETYYAMGWAYMGKNDFPTTYEYYKKSYDLAEKHGIGEFMVKATFAFATLANKNRDSEKEIELYMKCIELSNKYGWNERDDHIYFFIGNYYTFRGQHEEGNKYYKLSYDLKVKVNDIYYLTRITNRIGWNYYSLGNYNESLKWYYECIELAVQETEKFYECNSYGNIANNYRDLGETEKAIEYYQLSLHKFEDWGYKGEHFWIYNDLSILYEKQGDFEKAFDNCRNQIVYLDSAVNPERYKSSVDAQAVYEKYIKEKDLAKLKKEKELKEIQLSKNNYIVFGLITLLLLTSIFFVLRNRKHKLATMQRISELSQQVLRQQMNPHFIFNTLNSIQFSLYKNDKIVSNKYLSLFAKYMRLVLDSSQVEGISINEEINSIKLYLELERIRFKERLKYTIETDEEIDLFEHSLPPFLIQPYLENSINQNDKNADCLELNINFILINNAVVVKIKDNVNQYIIDEKTSSTDHHKIKNLTENKIKLLNSVYEENISCNYKYERDIDNHIIGRTIEIHLPYSA